jgi:2-methylcitrate dehydratase
MTLVEEMAAFVAKVSYDNLSPTEQDDLRVRVLDSIGCAIGALDGEPIKLLLAQSEDFGGTSRCSLIGGGMSAPDRAAFVNSALVRYLDFNDSYLAKGETCHPSDNLGSVLAAAEYAGAHGRDLLTALAVAYQVQCRLSDVAPVRARGFDHTTQGSFAVAAGVSKALGLDEKRIAHALAISGTAFNALRVTRTGELSHWKGLAYPNLAFCATHAAFLAMRGITGPLEVFEGNKGFMESIAGNFEIDWGREDLERVTRTIVKKYNAEIHSQSAIEGALELKTRNGFTGGEVDRIEIEIFDVAYNIIGGGEEGDKTTVLTKEQADHSLQYIVAVALLDGQVMPEQYEQSRIERQDVQSLLRKVSVRSSEEFSKRFPEEMACRVQIALKDGKVLSIEKSDYEGFLSRPMKWETVVRKFERLSGAHAAPTLLGEIVHAVAGLNAIKVADLCGLLANTRAKG